MKYECDDLPYLKTVDKAFEEQYKEQSLVDREEGGHFCMFSFYGEDSGCCNPLYDDSERNFNGEILGCRKKECPCYQPVSENAGEFVKWMYYLSLVEEEYGIGGMLDFVRGSVKRIQKEGK